MEINKLNRYDIGVLSLLIAIFTGFSYYFFWFTLDDAYIALRYSKHLAEGHGILWNIGADPVEGYTSFLWMVIGAVPHSVGLPPIMFMKILGVISTIITIVVIYGYGRFRSINRWILIIGLAQIAISPAVAVLSVQGMETTTAMLLVLFTTIAAIEVIREYRTKWAIAMNSALFIGMLTRPDLVIFGVFLEAGIVGLFYYQNRVKEIKHLISIGFLFVFLPGIVYMLGRYLYFGYMFPNPFYIKSGFSIRGPIYVFEFVMLILGPLLFLSLLLSISENIKNRVILRQLPVLSAGGAFLIFYISIEPQQGFLWRFLFPILPSTIIPLSIMSNESSIRKKIVSAYSSKQILLSILLISGLVVYPLFTTPNAIEETTDHTQVDRVEMGKALGELQGDGYSMFVTESGAIPYYSEWRAIDELGLNSEYIAHNGLTPSFINDYDPDLVQMVVINQPGMIRERSPEVADFLNNSSYHLVAVVHKQQQDRTNVLPGRYHLYFVDSESSGYGEISCALLTQNVTYADKAIITEQATINIQESRIAESDCN